MKEPATAGALASKIEALVLLVALSTLSILLPLIMATVVRNSGSKDAKTREAKAKKLVRALNFIAGGVFLGTILLHLLPDVHDQLTEAMLAFGYRTAYPFPEFTVAVGLLLFLLFEQFILWVKFRSDEKFQEKALAEGTALRDQGGDHRFYDSFGSIEESLGRSENLKEADADVTPVKRTSVDKGVNAAVVGYGLPDEGCQHSCESRDWRTGSLDRIIPQEVTLDESKQTSNIIRSYSLLTALSFHSVFEGMVVGFQRNTTSVWEIFFAIMLHKSLVAFGLGSRLLETKDKISNKHYAGLILVFTLTTPLGGTIGTVMSSAQNSNGIDLAEAILIGIATGSFVFVTFFEILRFDCGARTNMQMCLCMLLGFSLIAIEMYLHKHHHAEDSGDSGDPISLKEP
ncbi:zinc transporter ZIP1-like [Lineus longissimus]|uniref:zinc transporter ZIP1-like n=1 Tax=Lineus longissimus TaxID=88925 RepID=UPI002B4D98F2